MTSDTDSAMADNAAPLLSIIIPVRNGMPFLEQAIGSALDQLTPDMELIVRENFSTDGTKEWLAGLSDARIRVVEADQPASAGGNWTAMAKLAAGRYTKLLCADDYLLPGGLERQLAGALAHPDAALVASKRTIVDDSGSVLFRRFGLNRLIGTFPGSAAARKAVMGGNNPFGEPSSVIFRTDALQNSLPFTEEFPYLTDLDMYVKVLAHGSFVGLKSVDAVFRLSTKSWSQSIGRAQLGEYRAWLASSLDSGRITLTRGQRAISRAQSRAKFVARRVVTRMAALRSPRA